MQQSNKAQLLVLLKSIPIIGDLPILLMSPAVRAFLATTLAGILITFVPALEDFRGELFIAFLALGLVLAGLIKFEDAGRAILSVFANIIADAVQRAFDKYEARTGKDIDDELEAEVVAAVRNLKKLDPDWRKTLRMDEVPKQPSTPPPYIRP